MFPDFLKQVIVVLLLKKKSLGKMCTPIIDPFVSNIAFVSKVIERVVAQRLNSHMDVNNMNEAMQSAYKKHHSTETALLYILNDILSIDQHKVVLLVLLDLSAAFDTIDHKHLINRLSSRLGLSGCVLDCFFIVSLK